MDYLDLLLGLGAYDDPYADMGFEETVRRNNQPASTPLQRVNQRNAGRGRYGDTGEVRMERPDVLEQARALQARRKAAQDAPDPADQRLWYEYPNATAPATGSSLADAMQLSNARETTEGLRRETKVPLRQPQGGISPSQSWDEVRRSPESPLKSLQTMTRGIYEQASAPTGPEPQAAWEMYQRGSPLQELRYGAQIAADESAEAAKRSMVEGQTFPPGSNPVKYFNPLKYLLELFRSSAGDVESARMAEGAYRPTRFATQQALPEEAQTRLQELIAAIQARGAW